MSLCATAVGRPVEGPPLWTLQITMGVSVMSARPRLSIISEKPGPEVAVIALCPAHDAPRMTAIEASSSSIWTYVPPICGRRRAIRSATSVDGVIG